MSWKTPEDYKDPNYGPLKNTCTIDVRQELGCTERFLNSGFFKDLRWDRYAEYTMSCKNCPHYFNDVGIYFGEGKTSVTINDRDVVWCRCRLNTQEELALAIKSMPKHVKAILFDDVRVETLHGLEVFAHLECVLISYCPKLEHFWDFSQTPHMKVLEYVANVHLTDLSELANAKNLEYFGISTLTSRINMNYVNSFAPLKELTNLKELSLDCTMSKDGNIDDLINIPNLEKLWISPHTFTTEDFAKFEALKFKIYDEYGIYVNGEDYVRPLGKGGRCFRSENGKDKYKKMYAEMMEKYRE